MTNEQQEKLYNEYHRELYLYAVSLCKNHYQAQDLVSETFYKALLTVDKSVPYFKFWLFHVCKNLYIDESRKDNRLMDMEDIILESLETPLDKLIDNEERKRIFNLVMKLRPSYREAIVLHYYSGFSLKEIGKQIGVSENAAKILLFRARRKLKAGLEAENEL